MTLHLLRGSGVEVVGLLATITVAYGRVSMHGVREELVDAQARSLGLPLVKAYIPPNCSNSVYEEMMGRTCVRLREEGVEAVAFGDIFLEDVRRYREENLRTVGLRGLFPLWGRSTSELAHLFLRLGFRAKVVVVDLEKLSDDFVGREYDEEFLTRLPKHVDPCGENGEFHTFAYEGPIFSQPVSVEVGGKVVRDGRFCFVDLLPATL